MYTNSNSIIIMPAYAYYMTPIIIQLLYIFTLVIWLTCNWHNICIDNIIEYIGYVYVYNIIEGAVQDNEKGLIVLCQQLLYINW